MKGETNTTPTPPAQANLTLTMRRCSLHTTFTLRFCMILNLVKVCVGFPICTSNQNCPETPTRRTAWGWRRYRSQCPRRRWRAQSPRRKCCGPPVRTVRKGKLTVGFWEWGKRSGNAVRSGGKWRYALRLEPRKNVDWVKKNLGSWGEKWNT